MPAESYWTRRPTKAGACPRSSRAASTPASAPMTPGTGPEDARLGAGRADPGRRAAPRTGSGSRGGRRPGRSAAGRPARPRRRAPAAAAPARRVVGQELGREVVGAVDDDVVARRPARARSPTSKRTACGVDVAAPGSAAASARANGDRPSARRRRRRRTGPGGAGCWRRRDRRRRRRCGATPRRAERERRRAAEPARADDQDAAGVHAAHSKYASEREVALAGVAQDGDHGLARAELARDVERDLDRRARGDADQQALAPRQLQLGPLGVALGDRAHLGRAPSGRGSPARSRRRCPGCGARRPGRPTAPRSSPARRRRCGRRRACSRSTWPTPVMVPPVPTPGTNASGTRLPSWARISGPVVRRCASGLAGLLNCCGMKRCGLSRQSSWRALDRALHDLRRRREVQLGAVGLEQRAPLERHVVGHGQDQPVALGRADQRQPDAGVARGRLDDHRLAAAGSAPRARPPRSSTARCDP